MIDIDVHKDWGSFTLDVKLHHEGGILGLLGASGCGKSKTLQCIAGIEKPDAGKVVVGARTLFDSGRHINVPVPQRRVGYLFQHYALFPNMTVEDNIRCGVRSASSKADARRQVRYMMERLNLTGLEWQDSGPVGYVHLLAYPHALLQAGHHRRDGLGLCPGPGRIRGDEYAHRLYPQEYGDHFDDGLPVVADQ